MCARSECGAPVKLGNTYCSKSCAARVNNKKYPKREPAKVCRLQSCKSVVKSPSLYCSKSHQTAQDLSDRLTEAKTSGKIPVSHVACKKLIRLDRGWYCEIEDCRVSTWKGEEAPLILDHIDGLSDRHVWSNIRLVCPMCDAFLPTYKARNRGNGRHTRRDRYKNGQSY